MKKTISVLLSLIMLCGLLSLPSYAAGPGKPTIETQMPDCHSGLRHGGAPLCAWLDVGIVPVSGL